MFRRLFFLLVVLVLICYGIKRAADFGIGKVKHLLTSTAVPKGWTRVESDDKSVSIGLPPGWKKANISSPAFEKLMKGKTIDLTEFKLVFGGAPAPGQKLKPNGNIITKHTDLDLETLAQKNKESIATGAIGLTMSDGSLAGYPAKVMTYRKVDQAGNSIEHVFYIGLDGGNEYMCSFGFPQGMANELELTKQIAGTMVAN